MPTNELPPPPVSADDPRLWNIQELAHALGVHTDHIRRMKRNGFKMPLGRATVAMAHEWMRKNADSLD